MTDKKIKKRGGKRKGSGIKTIFEKKMVRKQYVVREDQVETLSKIRNSENSSQILRDAIDHMCYNLRKKLRCENSTLDEITMSQEILVLTQKIHNLDKKIKELENEQK